MQLFNKRLGAGLTNLTSQLGRFAADLFLDCVKRADPCERLGGDGRCVHCMDVVELASGVGPAGNFIDGAVAVEMMKAGIRIGLQSALEVLQVLPRMLALAIFRVCEPDGRRSGFSRWPIVAHIGPHTPSLGLPTPTTKTCRWGPRLAVAGSKHRNRC